jgi:hypothetical protein
MAIPNAQTVADRWAAGAGAGGTRYVEGVANTDVDVVGRAVAAQGALLSNFSQAVQSGLWARRLTAVGTPGWKAAVAATNDARMLAWANGMRQAKASGAFG